MLVERQANLVQQSFKARPSDVFLYSYPKSSTTWLKALAYAIGTREKFDGPNNPLLPKMPHNCIPTLERSVEQILENHHKNSCFAPIVTPPYNFLPLHETEE
ncbi:putative quercetin-3-sulfate 4'-sulfotransferase [Helianthus annuus]|uniref:Sulfotransferase n=1 Tax=Helianthus annuus TaxID=4232 RepID=A0A9K3JVU5_HELAN|nr:putative quercetin-3-sulfate 4'-sulfotransferase [Helianthus annuus]KAJ0622582.1 putative quercetin-3-sulfate 4'-sulfotransferase [Helianthus annuus]KAJ0626820.1 putative quercetin-3-sulfate 4'-sulfotransferase [Helianthus annuus]KAJ0956815.1 putative quercetin-3-sulfate 4'-sulfotransferase [Helianthus annuus]